jgi:DNA mismatch repair protein MutS
MDALTDNANMTAEMAARIAQATPVMAQYLELKVQYPDCLLFFRMGDFYELFFEDAVIAAKALSLALTQRGKLKGDDIPLAGVPYHAADAYIAKLIRQGFRVAVCEQLEDPAEAKKRGAKSVVKRGIVRVMTPGTLTEDSLLEERGANRLVALSVRAGVMALSAVELSTGDVECFEVTHDQLGAHLSALRPSETLVNDRLLGDEAVYATLKTSGGVIQPQGPRLCDPSAGEARLKSLYGVQTLDGYGHFSAAEVSSLGLLAAYIHLTQAGKRPVLKPPVRILTRTTLLIDAATRTSLEIDRTQGGKRDGSLIAALDMTVTSAGGRLLASRIQRPLCDPSVINQRLDMVGWFIAQRDLRADLRIGLRGLSDPARALSRLTLSRGNARDLNLVRQGLELADVISQCLKNTLKADPFEPKTPAHLIALIRDLDLGAELMALRDGLNDAIVDEPPLALRDGGFIKAAFNQPLDEALARRDDSR